MSEFITKDSGKRIDLANGMVRDTTEGKVDYTLILRGPLHKRWAELLSRGAIKYGKHNWCKALESTDRSAREATKERFLESAMRHFMQFMQGTRDEDHAAAVVFNMNGYEAMCDTDHLVNTAAIVDYIPCDLTYPDTCGDIACWCSKPAHEWTSTLTGQVSVPRVPATIVEALDAEINASFGAYKLGMEPL